MITFEKINEKYDVIIKKIYKNYFFANLDYEFYKKFVVYAFLEAEKENSDNIETYFRKYLNNSMKEYVKTMFQDIVSAFSLFSNFIERKIKNVSNYEEALDELKKVASFLNSVYDNYDISYFQEFLNNLKLFKMVQIVVDKNLSIIERGKLDTIFSNEILTGILQVYCLNNNIDFICLDDEDFTADDKLVVSSMHLSGGVITNLEDPLPHEEILKLFREYSMGNEKAKEKIIIHNFKLVLKIARKYTHLCQSLSLMDLFQEGNMGLMKAIEMFDPNKGCKFSTYAYTWIDNFISRAVYNKDKLIRIPLHKNWQLAKFWSVSNELERELGRKATDKELADALNIPVEKVRILKRVPMGTTSLNEVVGEEHDTELIDLYEDKDAEDFVDAIINSDIIESFKEALDRVKSLKDREKEILCLRLGINGDPMTLEEIGVIYKVTRERIRQIEVKAISKFRASKEAKSFLIYSGDPRLASTFLRSSRDKKNGIKPSVEEKPKSKVIVEESKKALTEESKKVETPFFGTEWHMVSKTNYGKSVKRTIYDYFSEYSKEEVDFVLLNLSEKEKYLIKLRYGEDLEHPVMSSSFTMQKSKIFTYILLPKIAALLKLNRNLQLTEEEQKNLHRSINDKISNEDRKNKIKTIYQYLSKFSREEVDAEILLLSEKEKEVIRFRNGEDLDNPKPTIQWNSKMYPKYINIINKIRRRLEKKKQKQRILTIYELLKKYSKEEIDELLLELKDEDKQLIYYANGEDLNNPVRCEDWNEELEAKYELLIKKLKTLLRLRKTKVSKSKKIYEKEKKPRKKRTYTIKTIYQHLCEFSKEEVDEEILFLSEEEKDLIRIRNGEDLENPKPSKDWNSKMYPKYQRIIQKLRSRLMKKRKLKEKKILTIYALLNSNKEEVDELLLELTNEEKLLMFYANGEDLNNPVRIKDWTDEMEVRYKLLQRKLRMLLKVKKEKMTNITPVVGSNNSASSLVQNLENPVYKELETDIVRKVESKEFFVALKKLTLKENMVILLRFGFVDGVCYPVLSIATFFGISVEEIYEIMRKVLLLVNELTESAVLSKKKTPSL